MTDNPMMTQYGPTITVPKWDPRIARRGALDAIYAEALALYTEAHQQHRSGDEAWSYDQVVLLSKIVKQLNDCVRSEAIWADPNCHKPVCVEATAWFIDVRNECAKLASEHFYDEVLTVAHTKLNVLRAHIRQTELMFCYEGADRADRWIQWVLNALSSAAYVAMWKTRKEE